MFQSTQESSLGCLFVLLKNLNTMGNSRISVLFRVFVMQSSISKSEILIFSRKFVFWAHQKWCVSLFCAIIEINKRRDLMIGENIKTLRKTHDLTQPEFAKIIGISRNSLSRYENGTSSVSTELVDRICKKFNVSYLDIVGEEKMLTPVEDYQLTLKIELIKERGANILAQLYRFQDEQGIEFDDSANPWVLMSDDLSDLINTKIYLVATFEEVERYNGYLDGIERVLEQASHLVVA